MPKKSTTVEDAAARSVAGPTEGWILSTSTTTAYLDLSSMAGRYVTLYADAAVHLVAFGTTNSFSLVKTATGGTKTAAAAYKIPAGTHIHLVVPRGYTFLAYEASTGTDLLRVHPS